MRLVATVYHDDDWAVSPSGQAVAMATSWQREDRLRLIDTATTAVRWERSMEDWTEFGPVWSHDERSVALLRGTSSGTDVELPLELLVIGADNGDSTLAVETPRSTQGFSTFLEWSGDDESILTGIPARLVRADDGTMVPFPVPAEDGLSVLVWSPDGQHILRWSVDSAELTIWSSDGREETPLGQGLIWSGVWEPWSPDGSHLAFVAFGPSGSTPAEFVVVDANGGSRQTLVTATRAGSSLDGLPMTWAWSPDGTELAVMESQRIWILPIDGGDLRDLMVLDIDEGSFYGTTLAWRNVAAGGDIVALPTFEQLGTPGSVEAFDAITGTTQWTVGLPGQPLMDIGGLAASGTVVAVAIGRREANQAIAGIDATLGDVIWTSPMENISRIDAGVRRRSWSRQGPISCPSMRSTDPSAGRSHWLEGGGPRSEKRRWCSPERFPLSSRRTTR